MVMYLGKPPRDDCTMTVCAKGHTLDGEPWEVMEDRQLNREFQWYLKEQERIEARKTTWRDSAMFIWLPERIMVIGIIVTIAITFSI